jgi:hypothetical protein
MGEELKRPSACRQSSARIKSAEELLVYRQAFEASAEVSAIIRREACD